jgi:hypothetical protein
MKQLSAKFTYANVISTLALFLVLAGGGLRKSLIGRLHNGALSGVAGRHPFSPSGPGSVGLKTGRGLEGLGRAR